ncbi:glycosyltransferase family 39 protein [Candidatus Margulisiibacteriota bacterium]
MDFRSFLNNRYLKTILAMFFLGLFLYGALVQANYINTDMRMTDQGSYINGVLQLDIQPERLLPRNRMPLYIYFQSLFYKSGMSREAFFIRGKYLNIFISVIGLIILYFIFRRYLEPVLTVHLWLITAFTVFIFKAGYFQAEILYYLLSFFAFLLFNLMLVKKNWKAAVLTGLFVALAYLTKASMLLGLLLFLLTVFMQIFTMLFKQYFLKNKEEKQDFWRGNLSKTIIPVVLVPLVFLAVVSPYIINNKKTFGRYFYNVNTTFYIWYDSFDDAKKGTNLLADQRNWPFMPADKIPSLRKYFKEHTFSQIYDRLFQGIKMTLFSMRRSYGYYKFILLFTFFLICMLFLERKKIPDILEKYKWLIGFNLFYFVVNFLACAWYVPIASGNRFVLSLFLPYMFSCFYLLSVLLKGNKKISSFNFLVVSILIGIEVYDVVFYKIISIYGGA